MRTCALVLIIVGATIPLVSQQAPSQTFRASTRLVSISVIVQDDSGRPVDGLTAADFTIREDGDVRPVALFAVESRVRARANSEPPPPGVFTNRIDPAALGGVTLIVIDRINTSAINQRRAHEHLVQVLRQMNPADRIGLYLLDPGVLHVLHDISQDTASLLRAVERAAGGTSAALAVADERNLTADPTGDTAPGSALAQFLAQSDAQLKSMGAFFEHLRVKDTTAALEALAGHLAGVRGRKNVIWMSGGFPLVIDDRGGPRVMSPEVRRATMALSASDIAIYPVDARGLMAAFVSRPGDKVQVMPSLEESRRMLDASLMIAEQTGGRAFHSTNDLGAAMARAIDDSALTYLLGYVPASDNWDGRFRRIRVSVNRRGVSVRHRSGYFAHPRTEDRVGIMTEALASPLDATGLPLSVAPAPGPAPQSLSLSIHLHAGAIMLQPAGDLWEGSVQLAIAQGLTGGRLQRTLDRTIDLRLSVAQRAQLDTEGLTLTVAIELDAGAHQVRLVAWDAHSGRLGSVTIPASRLRR